MKGYMINISLLATKDGSASMLQNVVRPLAIRALEGVSSLGHEEHKTILSMLRRRQYIPFDQDVVLSLSYDPKSCGIPIGLCQGNCFELCKGCLYNPLSALLDPQMSGGSCVITDRHTIDLLLDTICVLAKANQNNLIRASDIGEMEICR